MRLWPSLLGVPPMARGFQGVRMVGRPLSPLRGAIGFSGEG